MDRHLSFSIEKILAMPSRRSMPSIQFAVEDAVRDIKQEEVEDPGLLSSNPPTLKRLVETSEKPSKKIKMEEVLIQDLQEAQADINNNTTVRRHKLTQEQKSILESIFARKRYLDPVEKLYYSTKIGITEAQIQTWFQNKRYKVKTCELMLSGYIPEKSEKKTERLGLQSDRERYEDDVGRNDEDLPLKENIPVTHAAPLSCRDTELKRTQVTVDKIRARQLNSVNSCYTNVSNKSLGYLPFPTVRTLFYCHELNRDVRLENGTCYQEERIADCHGGCCQSYGQLHGRYVIRY